MHNFLAQNGTKPNRFWAAFHPWLAVRAGSTIGNGNPFEATGSENRLNLPGLGASCP